MVKLLQVFLSMPWTSKIPARFKEYLNSSSSEFNDSAFPTPGFQLSRDGLSSSQSNLQERRIFGLAVRRKWCQ